MKRLLYSLAIAVIVYLVAGVLLLILGSTSIFGSPLTVQSIFVVVCALVAAVYAYWRLLSSV